MKGTSLYFLIALTAQACMLPTAAPADDGIPVTARPAAELLFHPERSAPAEVVPLNDTRINAEINARVLEIPVRVGQPVVTGDLLVRLDCRDYTSRLQAQQATVRALQTRLKLARAQRKRARNLKKERNISDEEVDSRETEVLALEAELAAQDEAAEQAKLNRNRCEITAPFNAVVSERLASVGALAAPGTPLVHLVQLDEAEVSAQVRPAEADEGADATQRTTGRVPGQRQPCPFPPPAGGIGGPAGSFGSSEGRQDHRRRAAQSAGGCGRYPDITPESTVKVSTHISTIPCTQACRVYAKRWWLARHRPRLSSPS